MSDKQLAERLRLIGIELRELGEEYYERTGDEAAHQLTDASLLVHGVAYYVGGQHPRLMPVDLSGRVESLPTSEIIRYLTAHPNPRGHYEDRTEEGIKARMEELDRRIPARAE